MPASPDAFKQREAASSVKEPEDVVDPNNPFKVKEPEAKTVGEGFEKRKLKKLTPEQKAARKRKWNLIVGTMGLAILVFIVWLLSL